MGLGEPPVLFQTFECVYTLILSTDRVRLGATARRALHGEQVGADVVAGHHCRLARRVACEVAARRARATREQQPDDVRGGRAQPSPPPPLPLLVCSSQFLDQAQSSSQL